MAEKGSSPISSTEQSFNTKIFGFDVLSFTLLACGIPERKLRIEDYRRNDYQNSDCIVGVRATVLSVALNSRDNWKRMFQSRQNSSGLESQEKIQNYLSTFLNVLPEFQSDELNKIFTSLALYSEIFLFLNFNDIEVVFEEFLDMWVNYIDEKISPNKNADELFGTLFKDHPDIQGYLRLVIYFLHGFAIPYGNPDVSVEFGKFTETLEDFDDERNTAVRQLQERIVNRLGFMPHNLCHPLPEVVEESVSLLTSVLDGDVVLPGNRESSDPPESRHDLSPQPSGATGVEQSFEEMNLSSEKPSPRNQNTKRRRRKTTKKKLVSRILDKVIFDEICII